MIGQVHDQQATAEVVRRLQLHRLDTLLSALEDLNLKGTFDVPTHLAMRLRAAGVGHPSTASVSEVIDLVFRAQERFLQPLPGTRTSRRSAA